MQIHYYIHRATGIFRAYSLPTLTVIATTTMRHFNFSAFLPLYQQVVAAAFRTLFFLFPLRFFLFFELTPRQLRTTMNNPPRMHNCKAATLACVLD